MSETNAMTEEQFEDAQLDGIVCKACAWIETTQVESVLTPDSPRYVPGVRTWRGRAIVYDQHFLDRWPLNVAIKYQGALRDGEEMREICADVYIYRTSRRKRLTPPQPLDGAPEDEPIFVDFIGAGSPVSA